MIPFTIFPDVRGQVAEARTADWPELAAWCVNPPQYPSKQACPLIKLATIGEQRTAKGALRHDANILTVSGLEGDYDGEQMAPETAKTLLEFAGIAAVVYTSPSHTPAKPRWRVIAPFSAPQQPAARRELLARLNGVLGGVLAHESFTLSQTYYVGRVTGAAYVAYQTVGACIDRVAGLAPVWPPTIAATPSTMPQAERVATDETIAELRSALTALPADDYHEWIAVGQALVSLGDVGYELWSEWSATSDKHDPDADLARWSTFTGGRTDFAAVFAKAQRAGWDNPKRGGTIDTGSIFGGQAGDDLIIPVTTTGRHATGTRLAGPDDQLKLWTGFTYVTDAKIILTDKGKQWDQSQFDSRFGGLSFQISQDTSKWIDNAFKAFTHSQALTMPKVDHMAFRPDLPPHEIWTQDGGSFVNTYRALDIPRRVGDISPFLRHLELLLPWERDRMILLSYFAAILQLKGHKFQWAPLIQGFPGNGKSMLSGCVAKAVGWAYTHTAKASQICEKYNSWMLNMLLIIVEDIYTANDKAETFETIKPMITDKRQPIRAMQRAEYTAEVCCNFILNSNHKDGVKKTKEDRRIAPLFTNQQSLEDMVRDGLNSAYFAKLRNWLEFQHGYAIVAEYLHTFQIPEEYGLSCLMSRAPVTSSTEEAIAVSLGRVEQEIAEAIREGLPGFAGGWVSSIALQEFLQVNHMEGALPRMRRRDVMRLLGYEHHPGLRAGASTVALPNTNRKPVLYIQNGHWAAQLRDGPEIMAAYMRAQVPGASPVVGVVAGVGVGS